VGLEKKNAPDDASGAFAKSELNRSVASTPAARSAARTRARGTARDARVKNALTSHHDSTIRLRAHAVNGGGCKQSVEAGGGRREAGGGKRETGSRQQVTGNGERIGNPEAGAQPGGPLTRSATLCYNSALPSEPL